MVVTWTQIMFLTGIVMILGSIGYTVLRVLALMSMDIPDDRGFWGEGIILILGIALFIGSWFI